MKENPVQPNRRQFLGKVGVASAASVAGIVTIEPLLGSGLATAHNKKPPTQGVGGFLA
jgi:hypothetical protein